MVSNLYGSVLQCTRTPEFPHQIRAAASHLAQLVACVHDERSRFKHAQTDQTTPSVYLRHAQSRGNQRKTFVYLTYDPCQICAQVFPSKRPLLSQALIDPQPAVGLDLSSAVSSEWNLDPKPYLTHRGDLY